MKELAIVTSTRAEYGLLKPIINFLRKYENDEFKCSLIVTGTHLSNKHGLTINEIKEDGLRIDHIIEINLENDNPIDIGVNIATAIVNFSKLFYESSFERLLILGDRYEIFATAIAAINNRMQILHLYGGDTTEGALDEVYRHSITKMSYYHFVSNEESYRRVIQLGESPTRVFNYGSTGIDNILNLEMYDKEYLSVNLGLDIKKDIALVTYHPTTMQNECLMEISFLIEALKMFSNIEFVITKSNSDQGGDLINSQLIEATKVYKNLHLFDSLGVKKYLSVMKISKFVIGNSSSGLLETPSFGIPTINIGDRQKGRLQCRSIINSDNSTLSIVNAINSALDSNFSQLCKTVVNPYGQGDSGEKIAIKVLDILREDIVISKAFYGVDRRD